MRRRGDGRDGVRKKEGIPAVEISCVAVSQRAMKHVHQIDRGNEDATMEWGILLGQVGLRACYMLFPLKKGMDMVYIIVELRTPAMPVGVGGGKERGGFHLNLRT